jgi:hypothetical protein
MNWFEEASRALSGWLPVFPLTIYNINPCVYIQRRCTRRLVSLMADCKIDLSLPVYSMENNNGRI